MTDYFVWVQALFWAAGVCVAAVGAVTLIENYRKNRYEARWSEVEKAQQLIQSIFDDKWAHYGLRMLDGSLVNLPLLDEFQEENAVQQTRKFSPDMIQPAMTNPIGRDKDIPLAHTITHCFDSLFNHMHMIELYIEHDLVHFPVLEDSFRYYMVYVIQRQDMFDAYAERICYPKAKRFIARFNEGGALRP